MDKAKREFEGFCEQSFDCRNHETLVKPLRTECVHLEQGYRCTRGFHYQILDQIKEAPKRDLASIEETHVNEPESILNWRLQIGFGYSGSATQVNSSYFCCGAFDAVLQRNLFWRVNLGLRFSYRAGSSGAPQSGQTNVASSGTEFALSLPVQTFGNFFLVPEIGTLSEKVSIGPSSQSYKYQFLGGQLKYQSGLLALSSTDVGLYYYVGYRKYLDGANTPNAGIGIQFGF